MIEPINILHLEDLLSDADILKRTLEKSGLSFELMWVANKNDFQKALKQFNPHIILTDHALPSFNALDALKIARETGINIPFILITATMTDDDAAGLMKEGISDYILKDRMQRLPSSIVNVLERHKSEREKEIYDAKIVLSEKLFRAMIEKSADMITLTLPGGKLLYASPSLTTILGYTNEEFFNLPPQDFIHPDDVPHLVEQMKDILNSPGKTFYRSQRILHKNGGYIWCEGTVSNMLHDPSIGAMVSNFRDVTEKKLAEVQREFDANNLNALINNTKDLMWSVDLDFNLITSNEPFDETLKVFFGRAVKKGSNVLEISVNEEMYNYFKQLYERAFSGESFIKTDYFDAPLESWSEISYSPIRKGDLIIGAACHSRDITERKIAERKLMQSQEKLKEAQALGNIGNWDINLVKNKSNWSDQLYAIYGFEKKEVEPSIKLFLSLIHPDDSENVKKLVEEVINEKKDASFSFRFIRKDGSVRYAYAESRFELDKTNKPLRLFGILQDITERKNAEKEREKMIFNIVQHGKNLEQFTSIVSHNLRAPVANILGLANVLKNTISKEDRELSEKYLFTATEKLDDTLKDLNKILQVRSEINEYKESVVFNELVDSIKSSIQNMIDKENVQIITDFTKLDKIHSIKSYLHSIFFNLISNSIKYREPGKLPLLKIKSELKPDKIILTFKDNGTGIDLVKHGDNVFGIYKRFNLNTEGKGLGLFMVKTQVESLGGNVSVKSNPGEGAEFIVELPL